jgi:hypothetical protein
MLKRAKVAVHGTVLALEWGMRAAVIAMFTVILCTDPQVIQRGRVAAPIAMATQAAGNGETSRVERVRPLFSAPYRFAVTGWRVLARRAAVGERVRFFRGLSAPLVIAFVLGITALSAETLRYQNLEARLAGRHTKYWHARERAWQLVLALPQKTDRAKRKAQYQELTRQDRVVDQARDARSRADQELWAHIQRFRLVAVNGRWTTRDCAQAATMALGWCALLSWWRYNEARNDQDEQLDWNSRESWR